jgi:signal transduction histidine kinase
VAVHVSRTDVLVAAACALGGAVLTVLRAPSPPGWAPAWLELTAQLTAAATLLARRRHPLAVLATCLALSFVAPVVAALGALHATARYVDRARVRVAAVLVAVATTWPSWLVTSETTGASLLWAGTLVLLFAFFAGTLERLQSETDARATAAAEDAARATERASLARDLHDVVAHRISYLVVEAGLITATSPDEEARRIATEIGDGGRAALAEMRDLLRALTSEGSGSTGAGGPGAPSAVGDVERLADEARRAGLPVRVHVEVPPPHATPDLVDRTVQRVVSEGLTNVVRHAPGSATSVTVTPAGRGVQVTVENDRPAGPPTGLTTGGFGIAGLRERVELLGGTLDAGPTGSGGFRLSATLPRRDA